MSHCHDEHDAAHHGHGHGHGHGGDAHDHSDDITPALQSSLYAYIDFDNIVTLNERLHGSGRAIVKKTWAERLTNEPELVSDADEQLIINIPFAGQVKLQAIVMRTSGSGSAPRTVRVMQNREDVDFEEAAAAAGAAGCDDLELAQTSDVQELPVRRARFARVHRLTLFFPDNFASATATATATATAPDPDPDHPPVAATRITYLAFKGECMPRGRAPTHILYEAAANPADHKVKGTSVSQVGGAGIGGRRGPGL